MVDTGDFFQDWNPRNSVQKVDFLGNHWFCRAVRSPVSRHGFYTGPHLRQRKRYQAAVMMGDATKAKVRREFEEAMWAMKKKHGCCLRVYKEG